MREGRGERGEGSGERGVERGESSFGTHLAHLAHLTHLTHLTHQTHQTRLRIVSEFSDEWGWVGHFFVFFILCFESLWPWLLILVLDIKEFGLLYLTLDSGWDRERWLQIISSASRLGRVGQKCLFFSRLSIVYILLNEHVCANVITWTDRDNIKKRQCK